MSEAEAKIGQGIYKCTILCMFIWLVLFYFSRRDFSQIHSIYLWDYHDRISTHPDCQVLLYLFHDSVCIGVQDFYVVALKRNECTQKASVIEMHSWGPMLRPRESFSMDNLWMALEWPKMVIFRPNILSGFSCPKWYLISVKRDSS